MKLKKIGMLLVFVGLSAHAATVPGASGEWNETMQMTNESLMAQSLELIGLESAMKSVRVQRTALEVEMIHLQLLRASLSSGRYVDDVIVENSPGISSLARAGVIVSLVGIDGYALYKIRNGVTHALSLKAARNTFSKNLNAPNGGKPILNSTKLLRIPKAVFSATIRGAGTALGLAATATFIYGVGFFHYHGVDAMYLATEDYTSLVMNTDLRISQVQKTQETLQRSLAELEIESQRRSNQQNQATTAAIKDSAAASAANSNQKIFKLEE